MNKVPKIGENVLLVLGPSYVEVGPITDVLPDGRVLVASILKEPVHVWMPREGEDVQWEQQPEDLIPSTEAWMPDRAQDGGRAMTIKDDLPDFDPSLDGEGACPCDSPCPTRELENGQALAWRGAGDPIGGLLHLCDELGVKPGDLDKLVNDLAQEVVLPNLSVTEDPNAQGEPISGVGEDASAINNSGLRSQLEFLLGHTSEEEVGALLRDLTARAPDRAGDAHPSPRPTLRHERRRTRSRRKNRSAEKAKSDFLQIRISPTEKRAFSEAADLDGKKLSEWVRDRLRRLSRQELEAAGRQVPFLAHLIDRQQESRV